MAERSELSRSSAGDRNPWLIAIVVSIATFMLVLDTSIANVALRHIAGSLAAGVDESTWVITTSLIANAVILPVSGWLSGVLGRKRCCTLCLAVFAGSSLPCAPRIPEPRDQDRLCRLRALRSMARIARNRSRQGTARRLVPVRFHQQLHRHFARLRDDLFPVGADAQGADRRCPPAFQTPVR